MDVILQAISAETTNGFARPIDVLALQEQTSVSSTTQAIVDLLNGIYGAGTYARGTLDGGTSGAGRPGLVYNTHTVQLLGELAFGTVSTSAQARQTLRYQLRPVGYTSTADFYVYVNHYKAGTTSTDQTRRNVEATTLRANADALGPGVHALYTGDYNIQSSFEASYQTLLAPGNGQAFDPLNAPGTWHDNYSFLPIHTQSPVGGSGGGGLIGGGMDDRFDFQLATAGMLDGEGVSYIAGSYHPFGNNGTHTLNSSITTGTGAAPNVLNALATVSDHLPVVADYQIPARMGVVVGPVPATVIVGAAVSVGVTVTNTADVVVAVGADELDYTVAGTGDVQGSANGVAAALAAGNVHALSVNTTTPGAKAGQATVTSTSQAVANGSFAQPVAVQVLDHAEASFDGGGDVNARTIDFGAVGVGAGVQTVAFAIHNLSGANRAKLDVDSIDGAGDTAVLTTDLAAQADVDAGTSVSFTASFNPTAIGPYEATYTVHVSDEDLPGAAAGADLVLTLTGVVAASQGDFDHDGDVDVEDFAMFQACFNGPGRPPAQPGCEEGDLDHDSDVDIGDFGLFQACFNGPNRPPAC